MLSAVTCCCFHCLMRRSIRNFNIPPPGHLTVHPAWRGGNLNVAFEGWGIWTKFILFWRNTPVSFFGFCRVWRIYKTEFPLCQSITLSKGSLKEVWRCHYGISLWKVCKVFDWRRNLSLRRGILVVIGGAFERLFCPEGREFEQANLQKFKLIWIVSNWSAHKPLFFFEITV